MRFLDSDKLQINLKYIKVPPPGSITTPEEGFSFETIGGQTLLVTNGFDSFKGFLDKNEISLQYETATIAYAGAGSLGSVPYRILKNYNLDFSVYSEHLDEAIVNYRKLHKMINFLTFNASAAQGSNPFTLSTSGINTIANLRVIFSANPLIFSDQPSQNYYDVLVTKFSYNIIDDHGYVLYPFDKFSNSRPRPNGNYSNEIMIPLAYKVSIGSVINPKVETNRETVQTTQIPSQAPLVSTATTLQINALLESFEKKYKSDVISAVKNALQINKITIPTTADTDDKKKKYLESFVKALDANPNLFKTFLTTP